MYTFLGWLALGADCKRGSGLKPGPGFAGINAGLPAAPPATGGSPPVAGPFCAIANVLPPTSSAAMIRLFGIVIIIPPTAEVAPGAGTPLSSPRSRMSLMRPRRASRAGWRAQYLLNRDALSQRPLSGVKRTSQECTVMSANDPKRTFRREPVFCPIC
jgi:hypothetical protein